MAEANALVLARLVESGILVFLLISAFDIHKARRAVWREFNNSFDDIATRGFGQPGQPLWLYAVAFPFVAMNFGSMVAMLFDLDRVAGLPVRWLFALSIAGIALIDLVGWKIVVYRDLWSDILTKIGYLIGGAIMTILLSKG